MGCGCGKGRAGTTEVKDRKRASMGMNNVMTGQTSAPVTDASYNRRVNEYNRTLREFMNRGR